MNITAAILPHSFEEIVEKTSCLEGLISRVQIDLCDGVFGREKTWLPTGTETLPSGFTYEFDVMLNDWKLPMAYALTMGATSLVAHVDFFTDEDISALLEMLQLRNIPLGISVSNDKVPEFHAEMIRKIRALYPNVYIQVMGIKKIGEQGQFFDESAIERIQYLKQQFGDLLMQVDGGMKPENVQKVVNAGAETVVVGSFLFSTEGAGVAISRLESAVTEQ